MFFLFPDFLFPQPGAAQTVGAVCISQAKWCCCFPKPFYEQQHSQSLQLTLQFCCREAQTEEAFRKWEIDSYKDSDLFSLFDRVLFKILSVTLADVGEFDRYQEIILDRRTKYWSRKFTKMNTTLFTGLVCCSTIGRSTRIRLRKISLLISSKGM